MGWHCARVIGAIGGVIAGTPVVAQEAGPPEYEDPWRVSYPGAEPRDEAEAERQRMGVRKARIDYEIESLKGPEAVPGAEWAREWAGRYAFGRSPGMLVLITIAPKNGITYEEHGCFSFDSNHGDIVESLADGVRVRLAGDTGLQRLGLAEREGRLYFVRWGEWRYLVPERSLRHIVDSLNRGASPRALMHNVPKRFDGSAPPGPWSVDERPFPPGIPALPPEFAKELITEPIALKVTRVTKMAPGPNPRVVEYRLDLEGGRDRRLIPWMRFEYRKGETTGWIKIDTVDETSCTANAVLVGTEAPEVGDELTIPAPVKAGDRPTHQPEP